jgi:hypothetical protein
VFEQEPEVGAAAKGAVEAVDRGVAVRVPRAVRLADPAPSAMGLGPAEAVHADAEQPVPDRAAVEVGVQTRDRDRIEVDVRQGLVIREIGEMRDLADFLSISHGHAWSNDRACPWLRTARVGVT